MSRTVRTLVVLLLLVLVAQGATAQAPDSIRTEDPVRADSARVDSTFRYGWSRTFRAIVSETVLLQLNTDAQRSLSVSTDPTLGIQGLLVDETLTPSGRLFYETFYLVWEPPSGAESVSLTIGELPLPGNGTAITLRSDTETFVQVRLPRRQEEIEDLARQAVAFLRQRLQ